MQENLRKIAYLGPAGTFTQQAARVLFPSEVLVPLTDIDNIFSSLSHRECAAGVVPLENSTEGPVNVTLDALLNAEDLTITTMLILPIRHALMGDINSVTINKILAHPQALAQCRKYIRAHYPDAELIPCASNGEAAAKAATEKTRAAIGPVAAAKEYGLRIWAEEIQDSFLNSTSFIQVEHIHIDETSQNLSPKPACRTSIAFSTKNSPGALYQMLGIFENFGINMTKILSRPMPDRPGEYIFFVDIEDCEVNITKQALKQVKDNATIYRFLGSYPVIRKDVES